MYTSGAVGPSDFVFPRPESLCYSAASKQAERTTLQSIYLDHNATTAVDPAVIDVMGETATHFWANPSSGHEPGRRAGEVLRLAHESIAGFIGAAPGEIIFTGGGTEADNLALLGAARARGSQGRHVVISAAEHHAILESCTVLRREGFDITELPVDRHGRVDPAHVQKALRSETVLVSIMHANNEVGTIQPVAEIGSLLRARGILFHSDAAQSIGKLPVQVDQLNVDLLTCSSHKIYGPKGVGFLYVRTGTPLVPLLVGGGQEQGLRAGTENLPGIAGLAEALEIAAQRMGAEANTLRGLRETLWEGLAGAVDGLRLNGHPTERLPGTLNFSVEGVLSSDLLALLDEAGLCVSASAACTSGSSHPSHVLAAMGVPVELAAGTLRLSLGRSNSEEQIPQIIEHIAAAVHQLRKSPT